MKHSAAGSSEKPPDSTIVVLDENLSGHSILQALHDRGLPVQPQINYVARGATDVAVVAALAKYTNLVLVTKDADFRYKRDLVKQLLSAKMRVFVLTSAGNKQGSALVEQIAAAWPAMQRFLAKNAPPFVVKVGHDGVLLRHH